MTFKRPTFFWARANIFWMLAVVMTAPWAAVPPKSAASIVDVALVTSAVNQPLMMLLSWVIAISVSLARAFGVDCSSSRSEMMNGMVGVLSTTSDSAVVVGV